MKTVIITGASSGIGFALAQAYLRRGDNVVGNARTMDRLQTAAAQLGNPSNFELVAGDIAKPETAQALFERALTRFGRADILINNAGIFIAKPVAEYSEADVDAIIGTNLKGFFWPVQQAARFMGESGGGHIVNITTSLALQPTSRLPCLLPILIKGGLNQATRGLATELAGKGIKVNAVAPGIIDTPLHRGDEGTQSFLRTLSPGGRIGTTRDIVDSVFYLTDSDFVTGTVLAVDNGASAGNF